MDSLEVKSEEEGFALVEVLVSITILAIISLGVTKNLVAALRTAKFTELNHAASSLAISKVEELAAVDVNSLDSSYSGTESAVSWTGLNISFTRQTTVTVNADESRTVAVVVSSNNPRMTTSVDFSTTFANWE
jgi:prepilin-type N-terminal cleavage/methylation domain-containing protein